MSTENRVDTDDWFCWRCVDDDVLRDHIRSEGKTQRCALCRRARNAITPRQLAALLDPILREHFAWGAEEKVFDGPDDESGHWEEQGHELIEILDDVLGWCSFTDVIAGLLEENDPADASDGDEPFFTDYHKYMALPVETTAHTARWNGVAEELKQRRRFFSEAARTFFDWLFDEVESLRAPQSQEGVVRRLATGTRLYRARSCDSLEDIRKILQKPATELGPPPAGRARAGRMNAAGIAVFYGAMEADTCISEMRAPLGGRVALGTFELVRSVRLLDFSRMQVAYGEPLSYFDRDFKERASKGAFLRRVHRLVRAPVLPGHEDEYLITQAIAEYLAHVRTRRFDGILFGSAQRADGNNVVLFPTNFGTAQADATQVAPVFKQVGEITIHEINRVEYGSHELEVYKDRSGNVRVYEWGAPEE